jgi:uncharacterized protein with GYD domain
VPTYIALMNWTDEGIRNFRDTVDRAEAAEAAFAATGVTFKSIYWTVGQYDLISTLEAPDGETLAAALLRVAEQGNLRSTTLRALSAEEMRGVIAKAG